MIFHWYIFILIPVLAFLSSGFGWVRPVDVLGQRQLRYARFPVLLLVGILIYLAAMRTSSFGDTSAYMGMFARLPSSLAEIPAYISGEGKDEGFTVFSIIIKSIIGDRVRLYFAIIAAIVLLCVGSVYRRYSCSFFMSMFLFVASADFVQWTHNGIRQFIPVAILFACIGLLLKKRYVPLIIIILLLSTIHASVLLMIPMIFIVQGKPFNIKTILFILAVLAAMAMAEEFTNLLATFMANTQYENEVDQFLTTEGTNMIRVLVFAIPVLLAFVFRRRILVADDPLINLSVNMSFASLGFYLLSAVTSGIFVGRIPIYFSLYNYILLPWIIEKVFTRDSARLIYGVMIACYLYFYYYQIVVTWKLS